MGGEEAIEAGERAIKPSGDRGGIETDLRNALCRRRDHRFESEEQPCKDYDSYRCCVRFVRIDSLRRQGGNHVPDDERYDLAFILPPPP